jgi:hypothetical protein
MLLVHQRRATTTKVVRVSSTTLNASRWFWTIGAHRARGFGTDQDGLEQRRTLRPSACQDSLFPTFGNDDCQRARFTWKHISVSPFYVKRRRNADSASYLFLEPFDVFTRLSKEVVTEVRASRSDSRRRPAEVGREPIFRKKSAVNATSLAHGGASEPRALLSFNLPTYHRQH